MRHRRKKSGKALIALLLVLAVVLGLGGGAAAALWLGGSPPAFLRGAAHSAPPASLQEATSSAASLPASASSASPQSTPAFSTAPRGAAPLPLPGEMRAMWISFLEWKTVDFSSEEAFAAAVAAMFDNCLAMGLNTVIAAVRPFGDALYQSRLFPQSHVMTGTQGQDVGFDPLAVMVAQAHQRGLRLEAWVNPYRVKHPTNGSDALAANNPAVQNPAWVRTVGGEMWYDPGLAEVQQLVVDGVLEIVQNYDVDGVHFDDYFYPETADDTFDADGYAARADAGMDLGAWRRQNINGMMQAVYAALKAARPGASFGVSVQGNNENNYRQMYADVALWMASAGYADYVMPQLYWGFGYVTAAGRNDYAFANICAQWAGYPRHAAVALYAGLGAYRIGLARPDGSREGFGDGGAGDQAEWSSGHNLADMVRHLRTAAGFSGFALFRYEHLYQQDASAAAEAAALAELLQA